jgi:hypothetical protein
MVITGEAERRPEKDKIAGRSLGKKGIFQILVICAYAVELSLLLAFDRENTSL